MDVDTAYVTMQAIGTLYGYLLCVLPEGIEQLKSARSEALETPDGTADV